MSMECFKAYDIRGRVPEELNRNTAYRLGVAMAQTLSVKRVVVGGDVRASTNELKNALALGLIAEGVDVADIGLCGTEEVYFAAFEYGFDGGVMVTASHNPMDYNGLKLVRQGAQPISGDSGLREIEAEVEALTCECPDTIAPVEPLNHRGDYVLHLLNYLDLSKLRPLRVVVNPGNGTAGLVLEALRGALPFQLIPVNDLPDPSFPNGIPNPLLPENRSVTSQAVRDAHADFGVAWDGDFDRCFLFDENGSFIEGYYIVGLLAQAMLAKSPGAKVVHDPRLTWNTEELVLRSGGEAVMSKTGHAFIKERMRAEDAVYGGEMSAHHYFRDFQYCDNGMLPWLLIAELLCRQQRSLSSMVADRLQRYPVSGEINREVSDPDAAIRAIARTFQTGSAQLDMTDGLSMSFRSWRFNLRKSNTEALLRLNVETRSDAELLRRKTRELLDVIDHYAVPATRSA